MLVSQLSSLGLSAAPLAVVAVDRFHGDEHDHGVRSGAHVVGPEPSVEGQHSLLILRASKQIGK